MRVRVLFSVISVLPACGMVSAVPPSVNYSMMCHVGRSGVLQYGRGVDLGPCRKCSSPCLVFSSKKGKSFFVVHQYIDARKVEEKR